MDRINGWYKRKIGLIMFWLGLILCINFNVDSIQIIYELSNNEAKRLQTVALAEQVIKEQPGIDKLRIKQDSINDLKYKYEAHKMITNSVLEANNIIGLGWQDKDEIINYAIDTVKNKRLSALIKDKINYFLNLEDVIKHDISNFKSIKSAANEIVTINAVIANPKNVINFDSLVKRRDSMLHILGIGELKKLDTLSGIKLNNYDRISLFTKTKPNFINKSILWMTNWKKFFGILITVLALTLGAQFWFDLLKKLVSLRSAGVKPEEREAEKRKLAAIHLSGDTIISKDPVEIAISKNRSYWESLPGIVSFYKDESKINSLVVIAEKDKLGDIKLIFKEYSNQLNITYKEGEKAMLLNGISQMGFVYVDDPNSRGTVAGIFNVKNESYQVALTCAHVITHGGHFDSEKRIHNNKLIIGEIMNLIRSSYLDAATFSVTNKKSRDLINKYQINTITEIASFDYIKKHQNEDVYFKKVELDASTYKIKGKIVNLNFPTIFDNDKYMYGLFLFKGDVVEESNSKNLENKAYSEGGNSGSSFYYKTDDKEELHIGMLIGGVQFDNIPYSIGVYYENICDPLFLNVKII